MDFVSILTTALEVEVRGGLSDGAEGPVVDHILDSLFCAVAGLREQSVIDTWSAMQGDRANPTRNALASAGLVALAAHALQFDDGDASVGVHCGCVVVSAALSIAAETNASESDFIRAVSLGYRAALEIGRKLGGDRRSAVWHRTSVAGVFGAAIAAAFLYGIADARRFADVLGVAASFACGVIPRYQPVSALEAVHPAMAAEGGIRAARLVRTGICSNPCTLDGDAGMLFAMTGGRPSAGLGFSQDQSAAAKSYLKPYSCVRAAHGAIDIILEKLENVDARSVESLVVHVPSGAMRFVGPYPETSKDAALNLPFCLATALLNGAAPTPEDFVRAKLEASEIRDLFNRISVRHEADFDKSDPYKRMVRVDAIMGGVRRDYTKAGARGDSDNTDRGWLEEKWCALSVGHLPDQKDAPRGGRVLKMTNPTDMLAWILTAQGANAAT